MTKKNSYLSKNDTIGALIDHPAFRGFGHLLLPWNDRMDLDLPLSQIARLFPYHSHVDVDAIVQVLSWMIDASNAGETIFYDIYSEEAKGKPGILRKGKPDCSAFLVEPARLMR